MTATVAEAYVACAEITREQARNFHYGIRLLPPSKRDALCAIYALARRIDDIGDGDLPQAVKVEQLGAVRASLAHLDDADDAVLLALSDATRQFPVPLEAFGELLDGVEMDVVGARFPTFDDLVHYCRCVAGSIGRLCLSVFGARDLTVAPAYADALGVALQQTNILRDIREDYLNGRIYLPQEDLDRFGVVIDVDDDGVLVDGEGALSALVRFSAERASTWYDDGLRLVPLLDRRSAACCTAMSGIYQRLLERIQSDPALIRDRRLSLSGWQKTRVAVSSLMGSAR